MELTSSGGGKLKKRKIAEISAKAAVEASDALQHGIPAEIATLFTCEELGKSPAASACFVASCR
jgi:hypothetical protein